MDNFEKFKKLRSGQGFSIDWRDGRYEHVRDRIRERFQIDLSFEEFEELNFKLFVEDPEFCNFVDVGTDSSTGLYVIRYRNQRMLAAYSETAWCLRTLLPRDDIRLTLALQNKYERKANTDADMSFRLSKQEMAESLDTMMMEDGFLLLKDETTSAPQVTNNVFADALAAFKPTLVPAVATTANVTVQVAAAPKLDADVVAAFGRLEAHLVEQEDCIGQDEDKARAEIAELEARIAALRSNDMLADMKRGFITSTRTTAEDALAKYRDGLFTKDAAMSMASLMLAQQPAIVPKHIERSGPVMTHPDAVKRGAARTYTDYSEGDDEVTTVGTGMKRQYRFRGMTKNMGEWADYCGFQRATFSNRAKEYGLGPLLRSAYDRKARQSAAQG
jgi:hypothetical protein